MKLTKEQIESTAAALARLHGIDSDVMRELVTEIYEQGFKDGKNESNNRI